jgi:hypothetical protein
VGSEPTSFRTRRYNFATFLPPSICLSFLSIYLFINQSIIILLYLGRFFSFLSHTQSVGLLGCVVNPSQGRYLHTEQHKHRINAHKHPCLEWDFESTISSFERAKTVHALDLCCHCDRNFCLYGVKYNSSMRNVGYSLLSVWRH